ncbi:hypothetical protein MPER_11603 [Moniliophthora perniciosa FA553]|nr:hypothetical protein MPER_11603 [Moniliophthora perniciosa FA553]
MSNLHHWFNKDSIETALLAIDKQISACFQEFTVFSSIRVERKLVDHDVEVNRKLDELLRRAPKVRDGGASPVTQRRTLQKGHKPVSPPPVHPVNIPFPPKLQPSYSGSSISTSTQSHASWVRPSRVSTLKSLQQQADDFDSDYRKQRILNFPYDAITAARKAVGLRRVIVSMDKNARTTGALAKSLTYVARCLRDLNKNTPYHEQELRSALKESVARYREAFRADTGFRLGLAIALYNYSVYLAEKKTARGLNYQTKETRAGITSLVEALEAAHESVHHLSILENEEPEMYGYDLANALLNLSFILSDLGKNATALQTARRAVALSNQFVASLDDRNPDVGLREERAKRVQVLHRTWMRVSYCLEDMGMIEEAAEAEQEAFQVLESQI